MCLIPLFRIFNNSISSNIRFNQFIAPDYLIAPMKLSIRNCINEITQIHSIQNII